MKLFYALASPFVRKVVVVLNETGQISEAELVDIATTPISPDPKLVAQNPLAKIPALATDDGKVIFDSRVICRYLDARKNSGLYPSDDSIWDMLTLEAMADGIMEAAVLMTYERRVRPEEHVFEEWIESQWGKASRAVKEINDNWMDRLNGDLNIGQIAVGCALAYLDFRHDIRNWRDGNDALAAWYEEFSARPSMVETAPKG